MAAGRSRQYGSPGKLRHVLEGIMIKELSDMPAGQGSRQAAGQG
jgi:hypothetical protein